MSKVKSESKKEFPLVTLSVSVIFIGTLVTMELTDKFIIPKHYYMVFTALISVGLLLISSLFRQGKHTIKLNLIDIAVFFYFLINLISNLSSDYLDFLSVKFLNLCVSILLYFLFRSFISSKLKSQTRPEPLLVLSTILMIIGLIQSIYGFLQYFGIMDSLNTEFKVGGAYGNPGPYSNVLVSILPVSLVFAFFYRKKSIRTLAIVSTISILLILPFTQARTAWIAAIIIIVFILLHHKFSNRITKKHLPTLKSRLIALAVAICIGLAGIYTLTQFKEESASGRKFIWQVSFEMIKGKPVFGHGFDTYAKVHNNYQAEHFRENPDDHKNILLADNINYAFNEYIQIACEIGFLGLIVFVSILVFSFIPKRSFKLKDNPLPKIAFEGVLLSLCVISLFSYPLHGAIMHLLLFISIAVLSAYNANSVLTIKINKNIGRICAGLGLVLTTVFYNYELKRFRAEKEWLVAFHKVRQKAYEQAKIDYAHLYPTMKHSPYFMFNYGAELSVMGDYLKSVEILSEAEKRFNDSDYHIYFANSLEGLGRYKEAIEHYAQAGFIMPIKFYPVYRTVLLNQKLGNTEEALRLAKRILNMPVKVESDIVSNIRAEMKAFIDHSSKNIQVQ